MLEHTLLGYDLQVSSFKFEVLVTPTLTSASLTSALSVPKTRRTFVSANSSVIVLASDDLVNRDVCIEVRLLRVHLDVAQAHAFLFFVLQWFGLNKSLLKSLPCPFLFLLCVNAGFPWPWCKRCDC